MVVGFGCIKIIMKVSFNIVVVKEERSEQQRANSDGYLWCGQRTDAKGTYCCISFFLFFSFWPLLPTYPLLLSFSLVQNKFIIFQYHLTNRERVHFQKRKFTFPKWIILSASNSVFWFHEATSYILHSTWCQIQDTLVEEMDPTEI